jgi:hypothetical protein
MFLSNGPVRPLLLYFFQMICPSVGMPEPAD